MATPVQVTSVELYIFNQMSPPVGLNSETGSKIRAAILTTLAKRGPGKTCCPSEIPRKLFPNKWRDHMELTRSVSWELVREEVLEICQRGKVVTNENTKGPIRLRLKSM